MIELFALLIFLVSFIGMIVIVRRKIPVLVVLSPEQIRPKSLRKIKETIKRNGSFSLRKLLEKILSKFRILTLKTESKTNNLLKKLRQKAIEDKNKFSEDYWKRIKRKR